MNMEFSNQYKQQGSVVSFIVTGVLLSTLLIGGIVIVKRHLGGSSNSTGTNLTEIADSGQASGELSGDGATSSSQNNNDNPKEDEPKKEEEAKKQAEAEAAREKEKAAAEEAKKREEAEKQVEADRLAREQQAQAAANTTDGPSTGAQARSQAQVAALPTTGPLEDLFMMTIGIIAILGGGYVYYHYGQK